MQFTILQKQTLFMIFGQLSRSTSTGGCMEEICNQDWITISSERKDPCWEGIASFRQGDR